MATQRAPKGGAFGANGEWYEGGKFINSVPTNRKKEGSVASKPRKIEIEPYLWIVSDRRSIYTFLACGVAKYDRAHKTFTPVLGLFDNDKKFWDFGGISLDRCEALCEAYNNGKRFLDQVN